ncbi:class I SAM-dependent methyltransferase [Candidatus Wolfebacteria bacterium]|nr:class I SAM-dependent methyltransferase [Candidatus Wolfebacteria bacterium]
MVPWKKISRIFYKFFHGKEVVSSILSKEEWEDQYEGGAWKRLITFVQPNTEYIAEYCLQLSKKINQPISVVDLGCGNGGLGAAFIRLKVPISYYLGVDISEVALASAKKSFPVGEYKCIDLSKEIPKEVKNADVVICNEVIYYVPITSFLKRLKKMYEGNTIFSYYRSWRSLFIYVYIRLYFGKIKRYCVETAAQKWTIAIYEQQ